MKRSLFFKDFLHLYMRLFVNANTIKGFEVKIGIVK